MKKILSVILVTLFSASILIHLQPKIAEASTSRITVIEFSEKLVAELGVTEDNSSVSSIEALINQGIIRQGEFTNNSSDLTRGDMLILLSRADDYLNNTTVKQELMKEVIEKRISDIGKVSIEKREDIAKGFIKGLMRGYSNGKYAPDRNLKLTNKVTKAGALSSLKMLKDKSLRAKISPDGQLIRTTNLPKNAKLFPYILASFPNDYYEWQLMYQRAIMYDRDGELYKMKNLVDYASPADIDRLNIKDYNDFSSLKERKLSEWVAKAEKHLKLVFSADYRTIGDEWFSEMLKTSYHYGTRQENFTKQSLNEYIKRMKENKTIVEYKTVAVDGSSLYYFNDYFYLRVHVKYRVKSSVVPAAKNLDEYMSKHPYDKILFSNGFVMLDGYTMNKWKEGYYDIEMADTDSVGNIGVQSIWFDLGKGLD